MAISLQNHENRIVKLENNVASGKGLGYGQQWYDVTAKRTKNTVYINSTGQPIAVGVATVHTNYITFYLYVNDIPVARTSKDYEGYNGHSVFTIVPPGSSYKVTCTVNLDFWTELRADNKYYLLSEKEVA